MTLRALMLILSVIAVVAIIIAFAFGVDPSRLVKGSKIRKMFFLGGLSLVGGILGCAHKETSKPAEPEIKTTLQKTTDGEEVTESGIVEELPDDQGLFKDLVQSDPAGFKKEAEELNRLLEEWQKQLDAFVYRSAVEEHGEDAPDSETEGTSRIVSGPG